MDAAPKPGTFPMADRANIFGTLFVSFYDKWNQGGGVDACWPTFAGLLAMARARADDHFNQEYAAIVKPSKEQKRPLTLVEMNEVVGECWALMDRMGTWDWKREEEGELIAP